MQDVDGVEDICPTHVGMNRNALGYRHKLCEICPTHVGMNRLSGYSWIFMDLSAPRTWG